MALKDIKLEVGQTALRFWNFETTNKFLQICHWFNIPLTLIGPLSTNDESFCCIVATTDYEQLKHLLRRTDWGVSTTSRIEK